ncbi:unnamed protein product [Lota lota]
MLFYAKRLLPASFTPLRNRLQIIAVIQYYHCFVLDKMEEALRTYYTRMVSSVQRKLSNSSQPCSPRQEKKKRAKYTKHREEVGNIVSPPNVQDRTEGNMIGFGTQVVFEDMASDHRRYSIPLSGKPKRERYERKSDLTSHNFMSQGPVDQLVPTRLFSLLKHKTLMQETRRVLEVELHCPSLCTACEEARASLALDAFIRRKTTQLDAKGLDDRLSPHLCNRGSITL